MKSDCCGEPMYYRQIDGAGEAIPHCSKCHNPCKPKKEEGMSKPKTKEELSKDELLEFLTRFYYLWSDWMQKKTTMPNTLKLAGEAYEQIRQLIQNQPEVDEEWIEEKTKYLYDKACNFINPSYTRLGVETRINICRDFIRLIVKESQPQKEITMKDIRAWASGIQEDIKDHADWSYLADGMKEMVEEEFGIKVKK